jgi:hypothetical protein
VHEHRPLCDIILEIDKFILNIPKICEEAGGHYAGAQTAVHMI